MFGRIYTSIINNLTARMDQARRFYVEWIVTGFLVAIITIFADVLIVNFPWLDLRWIVGVDFFVTLITITIIVFSPNVIAAPAVIGIFTGIKDEPETIQEDVGKYFALMYEQILAGAMYLLLCKYFLWAMPKVGIGAFFLIVAGAILILSIKKVWAIGGSLAKKAIYWTIVGMTILQIAATIPDWVYVTTFGINPKIIFGTETQKARAEVKNYLFEKSDLDDAALLREALEMDRRGEKVRAIQKENGKEVIKFVSPLANPRIQEILRRNAISESIKAVPTNDELRGITSHRKFYGWIAVIVISAILLVYFRKARANEGGGGTKKAPFGFWAWVGVILATLSIIGALVNTGTIPLDPFY